MKDDWPKYNEAWNWYKQSFSLLDSYLYRLCRENPGHATQNVVHAKLWIIARTYATGVERSAGKGEGQALLRIGECIFNHRRDIDPIFDSLEKIAEPLTVHKLSAIISLHSRFNRLLREAKQDSGEPLLFRDVRSFVSKYLHFHCSAVPIYDSSAVSCLRKWYRWKLEYAVSLPDEADDYYYDFCMRFWQLHQDAPEQEKTVKRLDNYLLWFA
jgi:hypothetical protein